MKNDIKKDVDVSDIPKENTTESNSQLTRRKFVGITAASAVGFTILPRNVLGGPGFIAPDAALMKIFVSYSKRKKELMP